MAEDKTLLELLDQQHQMDADLIEIQKRTQQITAYAEVKETTVGEPVYDLYQVENTLYLELELAGVLEQDIHVDLTPEYLKITGNIANLQTVDTEAFHIRKRKRGPFEYIFPLPSKNMVTHSPPQLREGVLFLELNFEEPTQEED